MFYFFLHECFDISRPHNALGKDSSHHNHFVRLFNSLQSISLSLHINLQTKKEEGST